jgi:PAS domain S-box-containing protein
MRSHPVLQAFVLTVLVAMLPTGALADDGLDSWRAKAEHVRGLAENDVPAAYKEALQLQSSLPASADATDRARVLNLLARIEVYLGDTGAAERHAKEALELAQQNGDRAGQAEADLNNVLIAVNQGGFDTMTESVKHSMAILSGVDRPDLLTEAMLRTAMMYCRFDHFGDCLNEATQTLDIAQRTNNSLALAHAYQGMAGAYDYLGRHAKARDYYQKMRRSAQEAQSRLQEGDALIGLGSAMAKMGDAKSGERLIRDGIQLYRKAGGPFHVALGQYSLADNLHKRGRLAEAQAALNETVAIYERKSNKAGLWRALSLRSENTGVLGRVAEARADADRAYKLAMAMGQPLYLSESVRMQAATAAAAGDYRQAYRLSVEAELSAKKAGEQVSAHRLELARRDENRNQQRQIEDLTRNNEMQSLQNRWLWTVQAGGSVLLVVSGLFLLHLRRSREAVCKLNIGLDQRVRERTAELRLSQQSLAARERELRALADSSPGMMGSFHVKANGWICMPYVSPNIFEQYGLHPQDVAEDAAPLARLCHPEDAQRVSNSIAESARTMTPWHQEYRILHPTKGECWMEGHTNPQPHPDGGTIWYGYLFDITERKRMEETLATREREFRSLAENLPFNIARWDVQGRYLYINPTHERTLGVTASDIIGKEIPDTHNHVKAAIAQVAATGQAIASVRQPVLVDGETRLHEVSLAPERDAAGRIVNVLGIGRDMTDIYRMQEAIAAREQEFRSLAESMPENIIRYDRDGRILYLNGRLLSRLELDSAEEVIGKRPSEAWPDGRFAQIEQAAECAVESGSQVTIELIQPSGCGASRYHQIFVVPERGVTGQVVGTIAFSRDVTDIREAERRLNSLVENLPGFAFSVREVSRGAWSMPFASSGIEDIFGLKPEDVKGDFRPLQRMVHPDDWPRVKAAQAECRRTLQPLHVEFRVQRSGHPERWIECRSDPDVQPKGDVLWHGIMLDITERKKVQQRMELLEYAIELSSDAIYLIDEALRFAYVNASACRTLGYSREELLALGTPDIDPDADRDTLLQMMQTDPVGSIVSFETRHRTRDGHVFPVELNASIFKRDGARFSLAVVRDITERKQAEARIHELNAELEQRVRERTIQLEAMNRELRESEQRYREIFENVTDALYLIEVTPENQFRSLAFNRAFEKSTGIARNELIGTIAERVQEEGSAMAREVARAMVARYRSCIEAGKPIEADSVLDLPSGRRYYQSTLVPLRDDAGEIRRILGVARDVTEIKRVEREFRILAENLPDNIIRYDRNARKTYINTAMAQLMGVGAQALLNRPLEETQTNIRVMRMDEYIRRARRVLETGESQEFEATLQHAEKGIQVHNIRFVAERDEQGTIEGVLAVGHDITALKAIESELKESREQLRGLTARREAAREEERKRIAREVHDELGQILTGLKMNVSILNHKLGAGQELSKDKLQETMLLTDRALEVARNVASTLRPSALEMGIVSALEWLAGRFGTNTGICCDLHIDDNDLQLDEAHAIALFRILQESLTNVARHAKADRVDVTLRREAGGYVMKVRDNGSGFDASVKKTDSFGLVGIRERALMLGGTVDIDSCPGKGTEIVVRIPVQTIAEES